jgi:hypothetical protein
MSRRVAGASSAVTDLVLGVFGQHFDGAVQANIDVSAREGPNSQNGGQGSARLDRRQQYVKGAPAELDGPAVGEQLSFSAMRRLRAALVWRAC